MDGYSRISRYKSQLMGLAVMVVVYGHLLYYHSGLQNYDDLNFTEWYTLGSVEMFIFVSGFGIYQSLRKNRDAFTFYGRRIGRLLPSYLPVMLGWCAINMIFGSMRIGEAVGNLTAMGWWFQTGHQFNWYVPAILVLYLLSPLFYDCIERLGKKSLWVFAALVILNIAGWRSNLLMAVSRFPTYYLGMYMGAKYAEGRAPTKKQLWIWSIVGVIAMAAVPYFFLYQKRLLWYYGMFWNLFFFSTPACMFGVTKLLDLQAKNALGRGLNRLWGFLGIRSFEIYLCHLMFYGICLRLGIRGWGKWIAIACIGTVLGIVYHELVNLGLRLWKQRKAAS